MVKAKAKHAASQEDHKIPKIRSVAPITEREIKQESREFNPMAKEDAGTEQAVTRKIKRKIKRERKETENALRIPKLSTKQELPEPSQPVGPTSREEPSLVNAKKRVYETVHFEVNNNLLSLKTVYTHDRNMTYETHLKTDSFKKIQKLVDILKNCEIDTFQFTEEGDNPEKLDFWSALEKCAPFRFKTFAANKVSVNVENFLKNCDRVENVLLNMHSRTSSRDLPAKIRLLTLPAVNNAKMFQMTADDDDQELNGIEQENGPMLPLARTDPRVTRKIEDRSTNEHVLGRSNGFWPHRSMGSSTQNYDGDVKYGSY